jgi:hypothetical protein
MDDDCYLPGLRRPIDSLTRSARILSCEGDADVLADGVDRPLGAETHRWVGRAGDMVRLVFDQPAHVDRLRFVFDSDLMRETLTPEEKELYNCMFHNIHRHMGPAYPPRTLIRRFRVTARFGDGHEEVLIEEKNNYQRLRKYPVGKQDILEIRFEPLETWGAQEYRLFAFEAAEKAVD